MNLNERPCDGCGPAGERVEPPPTLYGQPRPRRHTTAAGILVVEEDDAIAEVFTLVLGEEGYAVERAASPREALDLLAERGPDAHHVVLSAPFAHPFVAPYAWLDRLREHTDAAIVICSRFPAHLYTKQWSTRYAALLEEPFDVHAMCALVGALCDGAEVARTARSSGAAVPSCAYL